MISVVEQFMTGIQRKPSRKWVFRDNIITGICAFIDYESSSPEIILPHGLTEDQRDVILWAYEYGLAVGMSRGKCSAKESIRKALGIKWEAGDNSSL